MKTIVSTVITLQGIETQLIELSDSDEAEALAVANQRQSDTLRNSRDFQLNSSDWTQVPDSPLPNSDKTAWATYRQALRDITSHADWPNLVHADWPVAPDGVDRSPIPMAPVE